MKETLLNKLAEKEGEIHYSDLVGNGTFLMNIGVYVLYGVLAILFINCIIFFIISVIKPSFCDWYADRFQAVLSTVLSAFVFGAVLIMFIGALVGN